MSAFSLDAIHSALRDFQRVFPEINLNLVDRRDHLYDDVILNMMEGYRLIDRLLSEGTDLFAAGHSSLWLQLNATVLCGGDPERLARYHRMIEATEDRFYNEPGAGIGDVMDWYGRNRKKDVWRRASGVYNRILSMPQLFIEGNHRTGALIMSYILGSEGKPPFVLTKENAKGFFNPSSVIKRNKKKNIIGELRFGKLTREFAEFLRNQTNDQFLASSKIAVAAAAK